MTKEQKNNLHYSKKRVVVAIGGNAILQNNQLGTFEEQFKNISNTANKLVSIISGKHDYNISIITHGNGPQVGNIAIQQEVASMMIPKQPMSVLIAMTQGQIGYMLQQAIQNEFTKMRINHPVVSIISQTMVDSNDPEFFKKIPSKPIGPFYTEQEMQELQKSGNYIFTKVKPMGEKIWRRVVPSPQPLKIVETDILEKLVDDGYLVIAAGGGGIPVAQNGHGMKGVDCVIDKDLVAGLLATSVKAEVLMILTDIDQVKLNFGKPNEISLSEVSLEDAKKYQEEGHFISGSMGPKMNSAIDFLESGGKIAIITSIDDAIDALNGKAGTRIHGKN